LLNRSFGCRFAFAEMISARSYVYQSRQTLKMLSTQPDDRPLGLQLLTEDAEVVRRALSAMPENTYDIVNLNAACPVDQVPRKGEGAGMLREPRKLRDLLHVMVTNSQMPVTVKIRSGWESAWINAKEVALYARDAGIAGLFIHGRTREQRYGGTVDYDVIREVKESLDIPVIASGDALTPELIRKMFRETGCDAVLIARGGFGNPWIFRETEELLRTGTVPDRPTIREITDTMIAHLGMCCDYYGEAKGTTLFRKFFVWYTRSLRGAKPLRGKAFHASTREQMIKVIRELRESQDYPGCSRASNPPVLRTI
jgi:nifR3 family TIM-barrel protein